MLRCGCRAEARVRDNRSLSRPTRAVHLLPGGAAPAPAAPPCARAGARREPAPTMASPEVPQSEQVDAEPGPASARTQRAGWTTAVRQPRADRPDPPVSRANHVQSSQTLQPAPHLPEPLERPLLRTDP